MTEDPKPLLRKWLFALALHRDPELGDVAQSCAMLLLDAIDNRTGFAFRSVEWLAVQTGGNARTVKRALKSLRDRGWFLANVKGGKGRAGEYRPNFSRMGSTAKVTCASLVTPETVTETSPYELERVTFEVPKGDKSVPKGCQICHPLPLSSPDSIPEEDSAIKVEFDGWWKFVPKRVAKGAALKAFKAARRKTDFPTLLAGIQGYSESVDGTDPKFIKNPATWLNGECWADDPAPEGDRHGSTRKATRNRPGIASPAERRSKIFSGLRAHNGEL